MIDAEDMDARSDDPPGRLGEILSRPDPPKSLRTRVELSLKAAQIPDAKRTLPHWARQFVYAAAAALLFIVGYALGSTRRSGAAPEKGEPRFALLLYAPDHVSSTEDDVEEHRQWARRIGGAGHTIYGEKLGPQTAALGAIPSDEQLQGFFIISAANDAEVLAIARSSPHFRHGGRLVIRKIDPT